MKYRMKNGEVLTQATENEGILSRISSAINHLNNEYIIMPFYTLNQWGGAKELLEYAHVTGNSPKVKKRRLQNQPKNP